jgi:2,4-dienoyl-CoA reductase-like NADH-dependent reductase (Old Yellow Enzyme family)
MAADIIFTPLSIGDLTVKKRIFRSSISGRFDNEDGSLTQTRINWECKFARGGVGAIISSFVPVLLEGRIAAGYATIHRDDFIPAWQKLGDAVHSFDCKFILQLSHSGRQMDIPGVANQRRPTRSSTSRDETRSPPKRATGCPRRLSVSLGRDPRQRLRERWRRF